MKSLRALLFVLVIPAAAACGGTHDSKASSSGDGSSVLPRSTATKLEPLAPAAIQDEPVVGPIVRRDEPLEIPAKFSDAMTLGKALATKGERARAKEVLEAAAKLDKKSAEPHIELARMYIAMGEKGLAIRSANKAVKLAPDSSQAYNTLGRAELARFNYDNAIIAFRQATELNPDNAWAWNNLGFSHLQLEHYKDAIDALETATSKTGAQGYMFNNLGTAYEHLDQLDDAREAFESGTKLGSLEAKASRKRLEGVDTIAIVKTAKVEPPKLEAKTYENAEEMPPMPEDSVEPADVVEPAKIDEPRVEEPTVEEPAPVVELPVKVEETPAPVVPSQT